jgi:hypothetical protein
MNPESLLKNLPWAHFLPETDVRSLAEDLSSAKTPEEVAQLLTEWRHTAEIYANPDLHHILTRRDTGDAGEVPRPSITDPEL